MKWPPWLKTKSHRRLRLRAASTKCPDCGQEMILIDRTTMTGDDMRTYRCDRCQKEHIVNFGTALWKALSDARQSGK